MEATKEKHATHTPGPWVVKHDKEGLPFIGVASDPWTYPGTVATVEQEKDARLIAAAPEMYDVLSELLETLIIASGPNRETREAFIKFDDLYKKAREVLAKVEGGEG